MGDAYGLWEVEWWPGAACPGGVAVFLSTGLWGYAVDVGR